MVKVIYNLLVKISITYSNIIGTLICISGIVYMYIYHDGGASVAMTTVGVGLILGRVITAGVTEKSNNKVEQ